MNTGNNFDFRRYDDIYISPNETKIVVKVVAADLKTLVQPNFCSIRNVPFSIENGLAWCNNCNNVSAKSACKSKVYQDHPYLKTRNTKNYTSLFSIQP